MTIWTARGVAKPSLSSDGAPVAVDDLEFLLTRGRDEGINILDPYYSPNGNGSDDSGALIAASQDATADKTVVLVPPPPAFNRWVISGADIPLTGFAQWKGVGSKQRSAGNFVGNERTPSVPIQFTNDKKFVATDFDETSAFTMENLRVMGTNTVFSIRDAFLPEFTRCAFALSAAPAVAGTPPIVLDNCINVVANRCTFTYFGSYDYKSFYVRNSGAPGNNLGSGSLSFYNCQFNGGGLWWNEERAEGFPGALTMIGCIGEGMTQGLVHFNATTTCEWNGITVINSTINDCATPTTSATLDVGANCIVQDFVLSGAIYTPALRVRNGGTARAGMISHAKAYDPFGTFPAIVKDAGSTVNAVLVSNKAAVDVYGGHRAIGSNISTTDAAISQTRSALLATGAVLIGAGGAAGCSIWGGAGAPAGGLGANGDFYKRTDGTVAGNTLEYHKEGGAWVAMRSVP